MSSSLEGCENTVSVVNGRPSAISASDRPSWIAAEISALNTTPFLRTVRPEPAHQPARPPPSAARGVPARHRAFHRPVVELLFGRAPLARALGDGTAVQVGGGARDPVSLIRHGS